MDLADFTDSLVPGNRPFDRNESRRDEMIIINVTNHELEPCRGDIIGWWRMASLANGYWSPKALGASWWRMACSEFWVFSCEFL